MSAQLSNKFGYCPLCIVSIVLKVHKHNRLPIWQIRAFISRKLPTPRLVSSGLLTAQLFSYPNPY